MIKSKLLAFKAYNLYPKFNLKVKKISKNKVRNFSEMYDDK